jgi:hypothetical protein
MDPEQRTLSRCFPFSEDVALKEPRPSPAVSQIAGDVEILPWIRRREPPLNISPQLVTCRAISAIPINNGDVVEITDVLTCSSRSRFDVGFLSLSETRNLTHCRR